MAKIRVIIDVEVKSEHLSHRDVGLIANGIVEAVNGYDNDEPEWYACLTRKPKFTPGGAKLWSVERHPEEPDYSGPEVNSQFKIFT